MKFMGNLKKYRIGVWYQICLYVHILTRFHTTATHVLPLSLQRRALLNNWTIRNLIRNVFLTWILFEYFSIYNHAISWLLAYSFFVFFSVVTCVQGKLEYKKSTKTFDLTKSNSFEEITLPMEVKTAESILIKEKYSYFIAYK